MFLASRDGTPLTVDRSVGFLRSVDVTFDPAAMLSSLGTRILEAVSGQCHHH